MRKNIMLLFFALMLLSGCQKWLDVTPDEEIYIDEALTDRQGFTQALSGIYARLAGPTLYGRNLEFGLMDALAGYWIVPATNDYYELYRFQYDHIDARDTLTNIWSGLYNNIRQCNLILDHIDAIDNDPYYDLIKGEALGLRAYLHLEAFKLFGPVVKVKGLETEALPYYTAAVRKPQQFLTSNEFLTAVETDLQEARINLAADPIIAQGREADLNSGSVLTYNSLLDRRGVRMNYYAVLALLARKSQWSGDITEAANRAKELISLLERSQSIRFMENSELENNASNKDIHFSKENIWGLYVNKIVDLTKVHFSFGETNNKFALEPDYNPFLKNLYEGGSGSTVDLRLILWKINTQYFSKYLIPQAVLNSADDVMERDHFYEVQLINLPEMYFMAAEDYLDSDLSQALRYINRVREARKLPNIAYTTTTSRAEVQQNLIDEVRREYIAEGYLFTYLKRLFIPLYRSSGNIAASENMYTFPIPQDERIYNTSNQ